MTPGLQLTWLDGDVVAWQPGDGVYGSNLGDKVRKLTPSRRWHDVFSPGVNRVATLHVPGGAQSVMCQRIDLMALDTVADTNVSATDVSASVAWFSGVYRDVRRLVRAGRVAPAVAEVGDNMWRALWSPLSTDAQIVADSWRASMPPVVGAAGPVDVESIVAIFTDQLARSILGGHGWRPHNDGRRSDIAKVTRLAMRALASGHGRFDVEPALETAMRQLAAGFDRASRRAAGLPVVGVRLRLGLPDEGHDSDNDDVSDHADETDADDPNKAGGGQWPLTLQLVDADDPSVWCTAADVAEHTPSAVSVARSADHIGALATAIDDAAGRLATTAPFLTDWLARGVGRGTHGVTIDDAAMLLESIDLLHHNGIELIAPQRLTRRKVSARAQVSASNNNSSGLLGATAILEWQPTVDGEPIPEDALRRAAESSSRLVDIGGRWVHIDRAEAVRALANLAEHRAKHHQLTPIELLKLVATDVDIDHAADDTGTALDSVDTSDVGEWVHELLRGLPDERLVDVDPPPSFVATLRPYQRRGLGWMQFLHRLGLGGCLADDMGLGKTPTTLAHLAGVPGPHLVVCPLSVVHNWEAETARFAPLMRVMVHHGSGRANAEQFGPRVASHDIVVTTYQTVVRDIAAISEVHWSTAVFDEAQAIKNPETATARAARKVPAGQRIALTGTPVENRLSELWSIMHTVAPGLLGNATQFRHAYADPIERERNAEAAAALRQLTSPFLLRRTKADKSLVPDLPDKVEQLAWATLTREQAAMYQTVVEQLLRDAQQESGMRRRGLVLAALTRLKQICNHPAHALGDGSRLAGRSGKLNRFDELITDLLDAGEQALVFTQFREMGVLLQRHLSEHFDLVTPFLHGGVAKSNRDRMVERFQSGTSGSPLLLVSLKAGGTGLNLTAASRVVHYDRWWNPAVEDQATDRAWRIGQQRSVFVHKLVCEGTVEERVDALIADKRALADAVVGPAGESWLTEMSTDDLRSLVMLGPGSSRT